MQAAFASILVATFALGGCASAVPRADPAALRLQVADTERAFAHTMATRDHAAFVSFLSKDAIFFSGDTALRGPEKIASAWADYYTGAIAPFSWEPKHVEVTDSGTLALSSGPVRDPEGRVIATFNSMWRLEAPGKWRIVFDKGTPVCAGKPAQ